MRLCHEAAVAEVRESARPVPHEERVHEQQIDDVSLDADRVYSLNSSGLAGAL